MASIDLFELLFGARGGRRRGRRSAAVKGEDLNAETTISLEEAYHGSTRLIQLDGQTIKVAIPRVSPTNRCCGSPEKGWPDGHGGPNGDLYLTVKDRAASRIPSKGKRSLPRFPG